MHVHTLLSLARLVGGPPQAAIQRLLTLTCEQLGMDVAVVSLLDGSGHLTVKQSADVHGTSGPDGLTGLIMTVDDSWCGRVAVRGSSMVRDARDDVDLMALPSTALFSIVSHAGVALRDEDGTVLGALCVWGHAPHDSLNPRDIDTLAGLADVIVPLLHELDAPTDAPTDAVVPTAVSGLAALAAAVESADDVERLTRPLLNALLDLTGLASTYLTVIHESDDAQEVRYSRNTRAGFEIPEGIQVPWSDTLCKRALDEGRPCVTDVPATWGDSATARDLGIQVYVSVPVATSDGQVWGTLCAADSVSAVGVDEHLPTMRLFAQLIAAQVEREEALVKARDEASTDPLTACSARRVVEPWLAVQLASLTADEVVVVAFADLDRFKLINDTWGHAAGDAVLVRVGHRLRSVARPHDLVARLGGDEFLVAARLPADAAFLLTERIRDAMSFSLPWLDGSIEVGGSVGVALSDGHDGPSLIAAADAAMYDVKRRSVASLVP